MTELNPKGWLALPPSRESIVVGSLAGAYDPVGGVVEGTLPVGGERPAIVQYWHEEVVPEEIEAMIATFRERNPGFRHLLFNESSAAEFIGERFGSAEVEAFRACAVPAMQADYFRYCAIYGLGGVYCDVDSRCIDSLQPLVEAGGGELFEGPERGHARNEIFAFGRRGHPLLRLSIAIATLNVEWRVWDLVWVATGPWIFRELIRMRRSSVDVVFDEARSSPPCVNDPRKLRYLDALQAKIGDDSRLALAFDGVRVSPLSKAQRLVSHGGSHLAYKHTEAHFPNFKGSIYR